MTTNEKKELLTVRDVAPLLGVSPRRVLEMIRARQLPAINAGTRAVRVPRAAFEEHLRRLNAEALASVQPQAPATGGLSLADLIAHSPPQAEADTADGPDGDETGLTAFMRLAHSPVLAETLAGFADAEKRQAERFANFLQGLGVSRPR